MDKVNGNLQGGPAEVFLVVIFKNHFHRLYYKYIFAFIFVCVCVNVCVYC